jgi:methanogenic corrinoid protein MtbC1
MNEKNTGSLIAALLDGNREGAVAEAKRLLAGGVSEKEIIVDGLQAAMAKLDAKCTVEQFNLLEIMLVGRALTAVVNEIYPHGAPRDNTKGTIVVASLEGDIHDIGKNIVKMVLGGNGYRVVDCGKDCPVEKLVNSAEKEGAFAVFISGLITSVIPHVRRVKDMLSEKGLSHVKVAAGGAALKQSSKESLNVDFVAETVFDGAHYIESIKD